MKLPIHDSCFYLFKGLQHTVVCPSTFTFKMCFHPQFQNVLSFLISKCAFIFATCFFFQNVLGMSITFYIYIFWLIDIFISYVTNRLVDIEITCQKFRTFKILKIAFFFNSRMKNLEAGKSSKLVLRIMNHAMHPALAGLAE